MQDSLESVEESTGVNTDDHFQRAGEALAAARKAKDFSLDYVSDRLKIPVPYLRAMEACHYDQLPGTTFVRGYLRSYARLVELNEDHILGLFGETVQADEQVARLLQEKSLDHHGVPGGRWLAAASLILLGAFVMGCVAWWGVETQENDAPLALRASPVIDSNFDSTDVDIESVDAFDEQKISKSSGLVEHVAPQLAAATAVEAASVAQAAVVTEILQPVSVALAVTNSDDLLVLRFVQDCWVEVKDSDGNVLFSDIQEGRSELSLEGDGPLNIKFGNVTAVSEVVFNGKPVSLIDISASSRGVGRLTLG